MKIMRFRLRSLVMFILAGLLAGASAGLMSDTQPAMGDINSVDLAVLGGKIIAVDPGHGGVDGGARRNGIEEKDITLSLALKVGELLKANGATVVYTRDSDIDYYTKGKGGKRNDLLKRVQIVNNSGANLFISIHVNAINGAKWSGAETYYNAKLPENKLLAETLQSVLQQFPTGNKRQMKQDSDILVLKDITIPGVLIEAGFLSNPQEALLLRDNAYQQRMAEAIVKAVAYHLSVNVAR